MNFSTVNFSGASFPGKNRTKKFDPRIRVRNSGVQNSFSRIRAQIRVSEVQNPLCRNLSLFMFIGFFLARFSGTPGNPGYPAKNPGSQLAGVVVGPLWRQDFARSCRHAGPDLTIKTESERWDRKLPLSQYVLGFWDPFKP